MRRGFFALRVSVNVHDIFDIGQCNCGENSHSSANAETDRQAGKFRRSRAEAAANDGIKSQRDRVHAPSLADEPDPVQYFNERLLRQASGGSKP